ncbi:hypothetical protein EI94DRAFT_1743415, partial [Lactarius quietus]
MSEDDSASGSDCSNGALRRTSIGPVSGDVIDSIASRCPMIALCMYHVASVLIGVDKDSIPARTFLFERNFRRLLSSAVIRYSRIQTGLAVWIEDNCFSLQGEAYNDLVPHALYESLLQRLQQLPLNGGSKDVGRLGPHMRSIEVNARSLPDSQSRSDCSLKDVTCPNTPASKRRRADWLTIAFRQPAPPMGKPNRQPRSSFTVTPRTTRAQNVMDCVEVVRLNEVLRRSEEAREAMSEGTTDQTSLETM